MYVRKVYMVKFAELEIDMGDVAVNRHGILLVVRT